MTSRVFVRDDRTTEVTVEYTVSGGSAPSGLFGPPEDYDPGSGFEVEVDSVVRLDDEDDGPGKAGDAVVLTDAENTRLDTEINEDPDTWEIDEPDFDPRDDLIDF